jgi:lipid-binding SYLF domain-containing protein
MHRHVIVPAALILASFVCLQPRGIAARGIAAREDNKQEDKKMSDEFKRIEDSLSTLDTLTSSPDKGIPRHLLERAEAIVVIPDLIKGGFILGAKHGRGVISLRKAGEWSAPGFITLSGGSIGWQIGLESVDLVLLVMNKQGADDLLQDKFTIGGAASLTAGPVGRNADMATDAKLSSQILAYSRANGLFAGATLEGASLHADKEANDAFYGRRIELRSIVESVPSALHPPEIAARWRARLAAWTAGLIPASR